MYCFDRILKWTVRLPLIPQWSRPTAPSRRIIRWEERRDWQPRAPIHELYALLTLANPLDGAESGTSHDLIRDDESTWAFTLADLSSAVVQGCHGNSHIRSAENSDRKARRFIRLLLGICADDGATILMVRNIKSLITLFLFLFSFYSHYIHKICPRLVKLKWIAFS